MKSKKRILLTGASGTVGYEVLKQLHNKEQYEIIVFDKYSRKTKNKFKEFEKAVTIHYGDITNYDALENVTKNIDVAIHLAALIPPIADDLPELAYKINVTGTENLLRQLEKNAPKVMLLYSSSISVYGDRVHNPEIYCTDPLIPSVGDEYAKTKIKAEKMIQNSSLDWSIFRLAAIMGNHKISKLMFHMPLNTSIEICTPSDTARAFVHAIEKKEALNKQIFNLGGGENCRLTYQELLARSFKIFGMGNLDFPEKSFAEKNFHCGNYADGDDLENILHFRRNDLDDYFQNIESQVNPIIKNFTKLVNPLIKRSLLRTSEPYQAYQKRDYKHIQRFFK